MRLLNNYSISFIFSVSRLVGSQYLPIEHWTVFHTPCYSPVETVLEKRVPVSLNSFYSVYVMIINLNKRIRDGVSAAVLLPYMILPTSFHTAYDN